MSDRIEWFLNANSSQVRVDMMQTVQSVNSGTGQIVQGYNRADLASGNLLKSNSRVARSGIVVAQSLLSGASATDVFASSLMGLERATRLPLGALLGLGVAAIAISKIHGVVVEFQALNKEAAELEKKDLLKLKTDELEKAKTDAERIRKGLEEQKSSWTKTIARGIADDPMAIIAPGLNLLWKLGKAAGTQKSAAERATSSSDLAWENSRAQREEFAKTQADLYHARRLADIPREVDEEIARRKHEAEVGKEAGSFKEKLQLSLADIAKGGRQFARGDDSMPGMAKIAQRALKEEALAKKAILSEDYAGAIQHQSLAESLKAQIPGLKDSEKIATFKSALDTSERLREIRDKISFKGQ